jgi:ribosome biogenesis GTPase / thiamine phosphate phosphatase
MFLESLGADAAVHKLFQSHAARGLVLARVAVSQRDHYQLFTEAGELPAVISGALWHQTPDPAGLPVTGDWVAARVVDPSQAIVEAVLPRRTVFSRRAAGRREDQQPVAANVDLAFLVCGLDGDFNLRRLERYMTLATEAGTEAVVVLNKVDLCPDIETLLAETAAVARGAPVVPATTRMPRGVDGVRAFLSYGRTVAFLGSSGVGKSAIINCLLGEERLRTNEVRESDSRGRHTTTRRELIPLEGSGALIDTPGMRELQLWAGRESVDRTFDDIVDIASLCRFRNCSHSGEIGCAVAKAIAEGVVSQARWKSYRKLIGEAKRHEEMTDRVAAAQTKKRLKAMQKGIRAFYRQRESGPD